MYIIQTISKEAIAFYNSPVFLFIKIIIGIYIAIVLFDIVLLVIQRNVGANWRKMRYGIDIPKEFVTGKKKAKLQWSKIRKRLKGDNEAEYKIAIIEADDIIDDLMKRLDYAGENMGERIANVPVGQLEYLDEIKEAHEIKNRIIHEDDFAVDKKLAEEILKKYEYLLNQFEVLG